MVAPQAYAATLVKETEVPDPRGTVWEFDFTIKSSPLALSAPLGVAERWCYKKTKGEVLPVTDQPWKCSKTHEDAQKAAQEEADAFESKIITDGKSTTAMEAFRLEHKLKDTLISP